jgi:hypothetical protein
MVDRRPQPELIAPSASSEEAAAIVAAVELFRRATAPAAMAPPEAADPWLRAAILEGVAREPRIEEHDPWINT